MAKCPKEYIKARTRVSDTGCWLWCGGIYQITGYGMACIEAKTQSSHRAAYKAFNGPIPKGAVVRHTCDVRHCCNPDHLVVGTLKENMEDCVSRGRIACGESQGLSKLTEKKVLSIYMAHGPQRQIAREHNISQRTVLDIKKERTWRHVTHDLTLLML